MQLKSLCQAFITIKDLTIHDDEQQSFQQIENFPQTEQEFKKFFDCMPNVSESMEVSVLQDLTSLKLPQVKFDSELYDYIMTNHIFLYTRGYTAKTHEMRSSGVILFKHEACYLKRFG
jgi:hypothetical protein